MNKAQIIIHINGLIEMYKNWKEREENPSLRLHYDDIIRILNTIQDLVIRNLKDK